MTLRIETFAANPEATAAFYERVLGFVIEKRHTSSEGHGYVAVRRDAVVIGIGQSLVPVPATARAVPAGTEIVLEVDDVHAVLASVQASGWPLESDLTEREWGLTDFRLSDPDGYYLRATSR
jgi:lactoylglutathione lyase